MRDSRRENQQLWDAWSDDFQSLWASDTDDDERPPAPFPLTPAESFEPDPPDALRIEGADFVELGCGGDQATVGAAQADVGTATGVDFSTGQLSHARRLREAYDVEARFLAGDVTALPLATDGFDIAYSGWVFQMVPDLQGALAEARRVLKPDGLLFLDVPHPVYELFDPETEELRQSYFGPQQRRNTISDEYDADMIIFDRTVGEYHNALVEAGLTVERIDEPGIDDPEAYRDGALASTQPELIAKVPRSLRFWAAP